MQLPENLLKILLVSSIHNLTFIWILESDLHPLVGLEMYFYAQQFENGFYGKTVGGKKSKNKMDYSLACLWFEFCETICFPQKLIIIVFNKIIKKDVLCKMMNMFYK